MQLKIGITDSKKIRERLTMNSHFRFSRYQLFFWTMFAVIVGANIGILLLKLVKWWTVE